MCADKRWKTAMLITSIVFLLIFLLELMWFGDIVVVDPQKHNISYENWCWVVKEWNAPSYWDVYSEQILGAVNMINSMFQLLFGIFLIYTFVSNDKFGLTKPQVLILFAVIIFVDLFIRSYIKLYLIDEEGNIQEVHAEIVDAPMLLNAATDEYQVTYEYAIAATDYALEANPNGYGISVFLTIRYRQRNTPAEVLLTSVSGEWEITDSRCSVTESNLHYGCSGVSTSVQNGYCAVNNGFLKNTGFSEYALKSDDVLVGSSVGAYICFKLMMGASRQYTFVAPNYLCGGLEDDFSCPIC